jgi:1-acyl-sn-glycerol-3-phosphate acyltransferase
MKVSIPDRWAARARVGSPGKPSAGMVDFLRNVVRPVARVFHRATLEGAEHLPATGPYLLVANHSAMGIAEIGCFAALYMEQVGADRPLCGVAHPFAFHLWPISVFMRHAGAVPSSRAACMSTLSEGIPILIFPGGDHEATRPIWQAHKVDFAGRMGFLKLARDAGVPIVPLGIRGSHFTMPILWRSRILPWLFVVPRLAGTRRWPVTLLAAAGSTALLAYLPAGLPVRIAAAWLWAASPLTLLPYVPATIRMRIGAPIPPEELFGDGGDEVLPGALARVEGAVRRLVDDLGGPRRA